MYTLHEEEAFSYESIIREVMSAADLALDVDPDAEDLETAGWARHASAASGFGDAGLAAGD